MRSTSAWSCFVVGQVSFDGECLVIIEALDGFGVGLDQILGQFGIGGDGALLEQVDGGSEDIVVVGQIGQHS